eukprot:CAMPEP_0195633872 /NCGR_PEP_ID=MMETSP0815-20121206/22385_1 /TAXON_ID=97485 /ORGANISM="Prymnesium parvum, Strain Texoma1" /LENGTH=53 /DNA_ID=CAMNT_0040775579 /DNA_START=76 /DNA_END=234 /DNA_ORIENTATION=+
MNGDLMSQIHAAKQLKLKKVETVDKSAPLIPGKVGSVTPGDAGGGGGSGGGGG